LKALDISESDPIPVEEWETLAQALDVYTNLLTLNLEFCNIDSFIAQAITEVLKKNQTLTCLLLSFNDIQDRGCQALACALSNNHGLLRLEVSDCKVSKTGGLPEFFMNRTLTSLNLDNNEIGTDIFTGQMIFGEEF
jgi:Ran GTPase-activating protein (RanGAP) involved in mRNA processing and transport